MCCGGQNAKDWDNSYWALQDPVKRFGKVPASCCKEGALRKQCERNGAAIATKSSILIHVEVKCQILTFLRFLFVFFTCIVTMLRRC